jgi:hypothetical protein
MSQTPERTVVARLAAGVEAALPDLVPAAVEAIWQQVPAYAASQDDQLRADVGVHVAAVFRVFLDGLAGRREARRADFAITREQATRRVAQGVSLADFLQAFRIGQLTLWQGILAAAGDDPAARDGALSVVAQLMQVIELGSTIAGEAYVQAQQHALAEGDRVRRDLLEDLLARRDIRAGPGRPVLRAAGLGPDRRLLVASAAPAGEHDRGEGTGLPDVAATLRRAFGGHGLGLTVVRHDEIVGIAPVAGGRAEPAVAGLTRVCAGLARQGVPLAVGVSTVHAGLHGIPEAYAEARSARDGLGTGAGVLAAVADQFRLSGAAGRRDGAAADPAAGAAIRIRGRGRRRHTDRHPGRLCGLRPECQDRGPATAPARQHRVLPAGPDRRADRL